MNIFGRRTCVGICQCVEEGVGVVVDGCGCTGRVRVPWKRVRVPREHGRCAHLDAAEPLADPPPDHGVECGDDVLARLFRGHRHVADGDRPAHGKAHGVAVCVVLGQ